MQRESVQPENLSEPPGRQETSEARTTEWKDVQMRFMPGNCKRTDATRDASQK